MKLTSFLTSAALVAFVSFLASLVIGAGVLPLFAVSATLFALTGMSADYGRPHRELIPVNEPARRTQRLPLAA